MDPGQLIFMIPIIGMSIPLFAIWLKHREKVEQMRANAAVENTAEKAAQYASHVRELEDRVRVLERIVTDSGYNIASQIDALRDTRQVEADLSERAKTLS